MYTYIHTYIHTNRQSKSTPKQARTESPPSAPIREVMEVFVGHNVLEEIVAAEHIRWADMGSCFDSAMYCMYAKACDYTYLYNYGAYNIYIHMYACSCLYLTTMFNNICIHTL